MVARRLLSSGMTTIVLVALAAAWVWHVVDLWGRVDPTTLPPRARRRLTGGRS
ncbi:MAG: hypothetical protein ACREQL_08495 [Candidatus Binatia bacterium]